MAQPFLFSVTQNIIENLGSQIFQEIGSLWGFEDELVNIKKAVSTIQAVLLDAAEQQSHNYQVKHWVVNLSDTVYYADDLLNELSTEASRQKAISGNKITKEVRNFFSTSNQVAFRLEMSRKIKAITKKLNVIAEDSKIFRLKECPVETDFVTKKREPTDPFLGEEVIGREEDKEAIIDILLQHDVEENVSVVPIVGIGGLGKTTLARYVYNDEKVKKYFELKMWVCGSDVFQLKIIIGKIIASATGRSVRNLEVEQLQNQLREIIFQKKYLLVLDDFWNEDREKWLHLKDILMFGSVGSKIVITTQSGLAAKTTCTDSSCIYLKGLSKEQSWFLFEKVAFSKGQVTNNPTLRKIGSEIVEMCQGVPLVIKSIGPVLYCKETESEWLSVKNNLLEIVTPGDRILYILKLSYDFLPPHIKSCLAYCSLFPKDYEMDKETMIQLWIAQGFIRSSNRNHQLEEVADEYLKDLLWRSFFEEVRDKFGVLKYKMHDLVHDLAMAVAGHECRLVDMDGGNVNAGVLHVSFPLFISSSFTKTLCLLVKAEKIRTFLLTCEHSSGVLDKSMLNTLILSFKSLRALDLHKLGITRVPSSIGKLIHLMYLDLSRNESIITLPDSITRLRNLQTLKVFLCKNLKELPRDIGELVNLRHLDNNSCDALSDMPCGLGKITCLQILPLFVVSKDPPSISKNVGRLGELNQLNSLRGRLEITHLERLEDANSKCEAANLREKHHLEELKLRWEQQGNINNDDEKTLEGLQPHQNLKSLLVQGYRGVRLSCWLSSLINLVDLTLMECKRCRHLPPLYQLPSLECLTLLYMEDLEYISDKDIIEEVTSSVTSTTFFLSLNFLGIYGCPNLKGWWRRDFCVTTYASRSNHQQHRHRQSLPSFPHLSSLQIQNCPYLTSMPLFPHLEECLSLDEVSGKPLQHTMAIAFSHLSPFSKLKSMHLINVRDLIYLPGLNMCSLKSLKIFNCPRLASLSRAVQYLTSLEELVINNCEEFNPLNEVNDGGLKWQCLNCLRSLTFVCLPKLESLPVGLQYVSTLQNLVISNCPNFNDFSEWPNKLSSLKLTWNR